MTSVKVVEKAGGIKNPTVVLGFPDVGLVGSITTSHLVDQLKLEEVGYVESKNMPPVVVIHDGRPKSPIRVYGGGNLVVLISEIPIPQSMIRDVSDGLVEWLKLKNVKMTLIVGGVAHPGRLEVKSPRVYGVGTSPGMDEVLRGNKIKFLEEGVVVGVHGMLLKKCLDEGVPTLYLLSESHYNYPDPSAAASTVEVLNKILGVDVDVKVLVEKGEEIRIKARDLMKRTHEAMSEMQKSQEHDIPMMYR